MTDYHSLAHQLDQNQELEFYGESTTKDVGQGRREDFEDKDASVNTSNSANDNTSRSVRPQRKKRVKFADDVNNANARTRNTSSDDDNGNDADDDADMSDVEDFQTKLQSETSIHADLDDDDDGSGEYIAGLHGCVDDESTLDAEMKLKPEISAENEISLLRKEAEISVEDLRAMYAAAISPPEKEEDNQNLDEGDDQSTGSNSSSGSGSEAFVDDVLAVDDETTIEAEERLGRDISYEDEITLLQRENEMSIEELRALYLNQSETKSEEEQEGEITASSNKMTGTLQEDNQEDRNVNKYAQSISESQEEDEFEPAAGDDIDDETTIETEERLGRGSWNWHCPGRSDRD